MFVEEEENDVYLYTSIFLIALKVKIPISEFERLRR